MTLLIADAGPLIGLARIERLFLLQEIFGTVIIPPKVCSELAIKDNRPGALRLDAAINDGWLKVVDLEEKPLPAISRSVDEGEAEAITLAISMKSKHPQLLIDDRRGRLVAKHHRIKIIGTAGVLLLAHKHRLLPKLEPILEELRAVGYRLSISLCRKILDKAGETSNE